MNNFKFLQGSENSTEIYAVSIDEPDVPENRVGGISTDEIRLQSMIQREIINARLDEDIKKLDEILRDKSKTKKEIIDEILLYVFRFAINLTGVMIFVLILIEVYRKFSNQN